AFVQRLADWKVEAKGWDSRLVRLALQLAPKAAQASAPADDPRMLPWGQERGQGALACRQAAQRVLFDPRREAAAVRQSGARRASVSGAPRASQDLYNHRRTLADAFRARDDALVRLPGYAPRLEREPDELPLWARAIETTLELRQELQAPPARPTTETFRK